MHYKVGAQMNVCVGVCARGAVSIVWGLPEYLFGRHVIGMFRKERGRGQCRQYVFGRD